MAAHAGVTVGAVFQWEKGIFEPEDEKKKIFVGLRKVGRREARTLLEKKWRNHRRRKSRGSGEEEQKENIEEITNCLKCTIHPIERFY